MGMALERFVSASTEKPRTPEDIREVPDVKSHTSRQKGKPFVGWKLNPPLVDILAWRLKQHVGRKTLRK